MNENAKFLIIVVQHGTLNIRSAEHARQSAIRWRFRRSLPEWPPHADTPISEVILVKGFNCITLFLPVRSLGLTHNDRYIFSDLTVLWLRIISFNGSSLHKMLWLTAIAVLEFMLFSSHHITSSPTKWICRMKTVYLEQSEHRLLTTILLDIRSFAGCVAHSPSLLATWAVVSVCPVLSDCRSLCALSCPLLSPTPDTRSEEHLFSSYAIIHQKNVHIRSNVCCVFNLSGLHKRTK